MATISAAFPHVAKHTQVIGSPAAHLFSHISANLKVSREMVAIQIIG